MSYQRKLLPLHASGIVCNDGGIHAFSGDSGAGKSTLTTALSKRGHAFFSDDVLIIDPENMGAKNSCYAGQKDLKLWKDALELTGASGGELISDDKSYNKFYANPAQYSDLTVGTLKSLYILSQSDISLDRPAFTIEALNGGQALKALTYAVYLQYLGELIVGRKTIFEWMVRLAENTKIYKFERPFEKKSFDKSVETILSHLPNHSNDAMHKQ